MKKITACILACVMLLFSMLMLFSCNIIPTCNGAFPEKNSDGTLKLSEGLISRLTDYFKRDTRIEYDLGVRSFEDKLNYCKNGYDPLLVKFVDKSYFVAAYFDIPEEHVELHFYCCCDNYTWVGFEKAEDVKEIWNGKELIGAFQINPQELCKNIKTGSRDVVIEHFSFYRPKFVSGVAVDPEIEFEKIFVYLNDSSDKYICYSSLVHPELHRLKSFRCIELDGKYYIMELHRGNLEEIYGAYYDELMSVLVDEYVIEGERYGLYKIEDIARIINKGD